MLKHVYKPTILAEGMKLTVRQWDTLVKEYGVTNDGNLKTPGMLHARSKLQSLSGSKVTVRSASNNFVTIQEDEYGTYPSYLFEECCVKSKFKIGQKVRFKSHEELKCMGERLNIRVDWDFMYTDKVLTIKDIDILTPGYNVNGHSWNYHEDFFQPVYELDDRFKEV